MTEGEIIADLFEQQGWEWSEELGEPDSEEMQHVIDFLKDRLDSTDADTLEVNRIAIRQDGNEFITYVRITDVD